MRFLGVHPGPLMYSRIFLRLEPPGLEFVAHGRRRARHEVRLVDPSVENPPPLFPPDQRLRTDGVAHQIVAVQRDVERAGGYLVATELANRLREPPRNRYAARANPHEGQLVNAAVALENFVGNPGERTPDTVRVHYHGHDSPPVKG